MTERETFTIYDRESECLCVSVREIEIERDRDGQREKKRQRQTERQRQREKRERHQEKYFFVLLPTKDGQIENIILSESLSKIFLRGANVLEKGSDIDKEKEKEREKTEKTWRKRDR
jgi:hypothetical protein